MFLHIFKCPRLIFGAKPNCTAFDPFKSLFRRYNSSIFAELPSVQHFRVNNEIGSIKLYLKSEDPGKEESLLRFKDVMKSIDPNKHALVQFGKLHNLPVCKIISLQKLHDLREAIGKLPSIPQKSSRQKHLLMLTWSIQPNDMKTKVKQLNKLLRRSEIASVVFSQRKGTQSLSEEAKKNVLEMFRNLASAFAEEYKQPSISNTIVLHYKLRPAKK
ncbi:translation initiation factor [Schizosaccharomyces japonicus yFS275]|uniref:Translation initiation factor n=1 Tax=Schizosaccharomyces japonicus (strain yFS275 / FY16936) TaxID=402676 RepID=B6K7C7_SCHJY|nr:translation initiation factor [Schizosaccharomyces japonicus yFS275]EEB09431.1 translation initiation factor [Schizosaccharomyces japonicus yFS275]